MRKVRIHAILGFSCANLKFSLRALILELRKQTSYACKVSMLRFSQQTRMDISFLRTFVWCSQASRLFATAKGAVWRSWLQVCVCEFREAWRCGSLVPRRSVRYTLHECKPGTPRSHLKQSASLRRPNKSATCGQKALNAGKVCAV